MHSKTTVI